MPCSDTDCAPPNHCDEVTKSCVKGATCDGDHTVLSATGGKKDCAPLKCAGDRCLEQCNSSADCVTGFACDTFNFQTGPADYCAPPVREGANCSGFVACTTGPCLSTGGANPTCYQDCANNPNACNNAQMCNTYNLQGGGSVSICEPPGVPPRPDAGVPPDLEPVIGPPHGDAAGAAEDRGPGHDAALGLDPQRRIRGPHVLDERERVRDRLGAQAARLGRIPHEHVGHRRERALDELDLEALVALDEDAAPLVLKGIEVGAEAGIDEGRRGVRARERLEEAGPVGPPLDAEADLVGIAAFLRRNY